MFDRVLNNPLINILNKFRTKNRDTRTTSFYWVYFYLLNVIVLLRLNKYRSNRAEVFRKKGVLRNFAKFIGKHLCQVYFLLKLQAWDSGAGVFP